MTTLPQGSWSYSGDPSLDDKDAVRFMIGDVDEDDAQISDEEIAYLIAKTGSADGAAYAAATALSAKFSRLAISEKQVGDLRIKYTDRAGAYRTMAGDILSGTGSGSDPIAYAGGISLADIEANDLDTDRPTPLFDVGMDDNPSALALDELHPETWRW